MELEGETSRGRNVSGVGGSRTLVQTGKPYAFYTLILDFGFRAPARPKPPTDTLAPKSHPCIGAYRDYFRFNLRRLILRFGTTSLGRRLVLLPCKRIKPVIYYTSIRQREHTRCCQLIFLQLRLWREPKKPPRAYVPSQPAVKSSQPQITMT